MQTRSESEALWWCCWTVLCGYTRVNSSVFSLAFKVPRVLAVLVFTVSWFQTVGAATEKARDETEVGTYGWCRRWAVDGRNVLVGWFSCNGSCRYDGRRTFFALKMTVANLKMIRCLTGSQCNCCCKPVVIADHGAYSTTCVRMFWARCRRFRLRSIKPYRRLLQQ